MDPSEILNWNRAASCADPAPGVEQALIQGLHAAAADRSAGGAETAERLLRIRQVAARCFGWSHPDRVIFTSGATAALNQAIHGCLKPGDRVLTTELEHNAVLRPLHTASGHGVEVVELPFDAHGLLDLDALAAALREAPTAWLALTLASNVLGTVQPVAEASALAREHGARVLLDFSQGGGSIPVDLESWGVDAAAVAGHKGLHGPRGIGLLFVGPDLEPEPLLQGGTGHRGQALDMGTAWPTRLEPGTPNYPGIFGLGAALDHLAAHPADLTAIRARMEGFEASLRELDGLVVHPTDPPPREQRLPILALHAPRVPSEVLAAFLLGMGVEVRSGMMCAARVAGRLGVAGGMVRLSPPFDTDAATFDRVLGLFEEALLALA